MKKLESYQHTIYASYIGYLTQAIVNNFAPLLFLWFQKSWSLSLAEITLITTVNFAVQLMVDLASAVVVDRIGYRVSAVIAHIFSAAGLFGLAFLPDLLPNKYAGVMISVICYAIGGGLIEVLISPIVEACPTEGKEAAMSLLHSFYCWGHVGVVLLSTVFFSMIGVDHWRILACLFALIPALNCLYFSAVPLYPIVKEDETQIPIGSLLRQIMMICSGASEQAVSQWSSAFAESALGVSKTVGDLAGPCAFAFCMGIARALYGKLGDKIPLQKTMSASALLCMICYLMITVPSQPVVNLLGCAICGFSVGIFWPGTFSIAARALPAAGTVMYALMALAGDIGCSSGPSIVGFIARAMDGVLKAGIQGAIVFPVVMLISLFILRSFKRKA